MDDGRPQTTTATPEPLARCGGALQDPAARARVAAALFGEEAPAASTELPRSLTKSGQIVVAPRTSQYPSQVARYRVDALIGQGAMGRVFRAHDPELDRTLAIKILHAEHASDERARTRIVREARALARLSHPNVVHVYDVGETDAGFFIAMEWVSGTTLSAWVRRRAHPWRELVEVFLAAGEGLSAAHGAGLVHRDFKPDNVIVGDDGRVRVLDFGLARATSPSAGELMQPRVRVGGLKDRNTSLTQTGALMGTPIYLAPEIYAGHPADALSDQFSFCVALYEAIYGQRPFAGHSLESYAEEVMSGVIRPAPKVAAIPAEVEEVIRRGLAREPTDRYPDLSACLDALRDVMLSSRSSVLASRERSGTRRFGAWLAQPAVIVAGLGLFAIAVSSAGLVWQNENEESPPAVLAVNLSSLEIGEGEGRPGARDPELDSPSEIADNGQIIAADNMPPLSNAAQSPKLAQEPASPGENPSEAAQESDTAMPTVAPAQEELEVAQDDATPVKKPVVRIRQGAASRDGWCSLHEDTYRLITRDRGPNRVFSAKGQCYVCRIENRESRTKGFSPRDCTGYQLCGPVEDAQCVLALE